VMVVRAIVWLLSAGVKLSCLTWLRRGVGRAGYERL
jgi:hypothetical protein